MADTHTDYPGSGRWCVRVFPNPWLSLGFHVDHKNPSITFHLPGRCIAIGRLRLVDYAS